MSIRLRFTLLYNAILAATLILFGVTLYSIQAQVTLNAIKKDISSSSQSLQNSVLQAVSSLNTESTPSSETQPPASQPPVSGQSGQTSSQATPASQSPSNNQAGQSSGGPTPPPIPFQTFSNDQTFQRLSDIEIVRVLDTDGNLIASPYGSTQETLPLSSAGLQTLKNNQDYWQQASINGQSVLIYNRPIEANGKIAYILQVAQPLTQRQHSMQVLGTTILIGILVTLLASFGVGWIVSGYTFRPIQHLTETAQSIGKERDFTRRVDYQGPADEVGQLANTFNAMLSRLQEAYQQLALSLEQQRNFVADVSHELRTPLTTLRGNLGLLGHLPPLPDEERKDIVNDMVEESDRLIRLVNELLVLARADAEQNLTPKPIILLPVIEEACRQAQQLDPQRQISLQVSPDLVLLGERDALKQILLVGLDNAIKYTSHEIKVSATQREDEIEIRIRDFGPGIPADKLAHLFDRFKRSEVVAEIAGFGLGLPIARALTEGLQGHLEVESQAGQGTTLIFTFQSASPSTL